MDRELLVLFLKDVRDDYLEMLEESEECSWSPVKLQEVRINLGSLITELEEGNI